MVLILKHSRESPISNEKQSENETPVHEAFFKTNMRCTKIRKVVNYVYLHSDITCQIEYCHMCLRGNKVPRPPLKLESPTGNSAVTKPSPILILDSCIVLDHFDFLQKDESVSNCLFMSTVVDTVRRKKPYLGSKLKLLCMATAESADTSETRFVVFPNEYFTETCVVRKDNEDLEDRDRRAIVTAAKWFNNHVSQIYSRNISAYGLESRVWFLTSNRKMMSICKEEGIPVLSPHKYVAMMSAYYPNSGEYLGTEVISDDEGSDTEMATSETSKIKRRRKTPKEIFPPHLSEPECRARLKKGTAFQGTLHLKFHTHLDGYVSCVVDRPDIHVRGALNLNRAMDSDVVVVEMIKENEDMNVTEMENLDHVILNDDGTESRKEDIDSSPKLPDVFSVSDSLEKGKIIGILRRGRTEICGTLRPLDGDGAGVCLFSRIDRVFIPYSRKLPLVEIKTRKSKLLDNKRILVSVDSWDRFSRRPKGHWVEVLGDVGDKGTENDVILREHGVVVRDFPLTVYRCLPAADFVIPESEISKRLDLRFSENHMTFSIDPDGCKDIDDALSVRILDNGNVEAGVHIADVSYFVKPNSALDIEASERCTTVYLVDRRTDMLPSLLTTDLCSLVPDKDRLAFSVMWEITPKAEIISTKCLKTVIRSIAKLTYEEAQARIDDSRDFSRLTGCIRTLNELAKIMEKKRANRGSLQLASPEPTFAVDKETHDPTDVTIYEYKESNKLVETFMLLANTCVASAITKKYPTLAVLRRHPLPRMNNLDELAQALKSIGIHDFKYASSFELGKSLDSIISTQDNDFMNMMVRMMTTRCMSKALYFCAGCEDPSEYRHYGLALDIYTHFTSPIRRYADLMVHRFLAAALDLEGLPDKLYTKDQVSQQCKVLNRKNTAAFHAALASIEFNSYLFFKTRDVVQDGVIFQIRQHSIRVHVPYYGLDGVIEFAKGDYTYDEKTSTLKSQTECKLLKLFDKCRVRIRGMIRNFRSSVEFTLADESLR